MMGQRVLQASEEVRWRGERASICAEMLCVRCGAARGGRMRREADKQLQLSRASMLGAATHIPLPRVLGWAGCACGRLSAGARGVGCDAMWSAGCGRQARVAAREGAGLHLLWGCGFFRSRYQQHEKKRQMMPTRPSRPA